MNKRLVAMSVYTAALTQGLCVVSFPASASVLKAALSDAQYGAIFVPQMFATIAGSLLASRLGPRAAGGRTLTLALCASALAELLLAAAAVGGGFAAAACGTFALGFGFGLSAPALNAWPGRLFPDRAETALVALHTVLAGGFAFGPALASSTSGAGIWLAFPLALCVFALVCAASAGRFVPSTQATHSAVVAAAPAELVPGTRAAFLAIALLYALAEGTFANWAVVYLREERALSEPWAALALTTFWSALALGRLLASALLVRFAAVTIWRALPLAMALAFLALPFVQGVPAALLGFAFAGLACSAFFPLTVSLGAASFAGGAARASSLLTAALMVGVGVGSFVIGPLRGAASLSALYQVSAVYPLVALGLCVWVTTAVKRLSHPGVADS